MQRKVLILYPSASAACGIGTWVDALSLSLKEYAWDVTVGLAWGAKFHNPGKVQTFRPALKTIRMDGRTGTAEGRIQAIERTVSAVKPDVIIVTVLDAAFEAARRLRYKGAIFRLIAVNHGNLPGQAACLLDNMDVVDMAVCVSKLSYRSMAMQVSGFSPERIRHISNAVAVSEDAVSRSGHAFRVGYVGRLDSDKRAEDIVPFFTAFHERCPDAQMWVAGRGRAEPMIQNLANKFPDCFNYCGELSRIDLDENFYSGLDVLVHFSPSEAWGYSIAEAMSFGIVPVVSAFRGVYMDGLVLESKNALVFPVGDHARAVELVAGLYEDRNMLKHLGAAARQHIIDKFSFGVFGKLWADALNACVQLPELQALSRPSSLDKKGPYGVPWPFWERCRRLIRMRIPHSSPGEEWPHYQCADKELMQRIEQSMQGLSEG